MDNRSIFEALLLEENVAKDESVCIGDYINLYCEDTGGFVYSDQTSTAYNGLFVYQDQEHEKPSGIPNIHAITFQILSQNRYKLEKKYRRLTAEHGTESDDPETKNILRQAKLAADAEKDDNGAEQARLKGTQLIYGQLVQLRHVLTHKYIHTSSIDTSVVDKNKMVVQLHPYNAKHAQFRIVPRYKVKVEGEKVQVNDRITLESMKSPGAYLHASLPYRINHTFMGSELNLGAEFATFVIRKNLRPSEQDKEYVKGGSVISLFHKELEARLSAEGIFNEQPTENVHLRVREINHLDLRTVYNPKSGISYWQVEAVDSILLGKAIHWEEYIRLRHMTTRRYLSVAVDSSLVLTEDHDDPRTVFCFHSLSAQPETSIVHFESDTRIEHMISGYWIHAEITDLYISLSCEDEQKDSMSSLRKNKSTLIRVECCQSQQYPDAFTLQKVMEEDVRVFNYVAGMVPFIRDLILDREAGIKWTANRCANICSALQELTHFIVVDGVPVKNRQKLLRNLKVVDVLVSLLGCDSDVSDWEHLSTVYRTTYKVLHSYTRGNSKKNSLYIAKYFQFFQRQLSKPDGVGLQCCIMLTDLVKDNRQIVDRITPNDITLIINTLRKNKHFRYLELLGVLCVCNGIAIKENQSFIAKNLLEKHKVC